MKNNKLYLIKLGGSLITDKAKPYTPRINVIKRLANEIKKGKQKKDKIIIGHGGGSFPHVTAAQYQTYKGFINEESKIGMTIVHKDAATLNKIVIEKFLEFRLEVFPIQPSSISLTENGNIKYMYMDTIKTLLNQGFIPIIYGDVGIDLKQGCCIISTEEIFRYIALELKEEYNPFIIMCESVDGIYTKDPIIYKDAEFIDIITKDNIDEVRSYLSSSYGIDVTGGMRHKVEVLYELATQGINSIIINCLKKGSLEKILNGEEIKGTNIKYQ